MEWFADLSNRGHALWDFFEAERSTLNREAVAATARGAAQGGHREAGQEDEDEPGEPQVHHCGFREEFQTQNLGRGRDRKSISPPKLFFNYLFFIVKTKIDSSCR